MRQIKQHKIKLVMAFLIILFLGGLIIYSIKDNAVKSSFESETSGFVRINNLEKNTSEDTNEFKESQANTIKVDVSGEINHPGVYELSPDSRIEDLIKLAGGVTTNANLNVTNQSLRLKDQDKIIIKRQNSDTENVNTPPDEPEVTQNAKVNLNTASEAQLQAITGIGQKKAQRIIDYRQKNGRFSSVDDLKKISGIGDKFIESIRADVEV
ncbi:ComEA family DNA-binding protein [Holzapfeliella sp. He02]|uniref:ComEA family DNA-binding protein n=1 Tax=Holzapfeliella saturejae TaxID=3082953 RepID=A0ABU8SG40_9LACO